MKQSMILGIGAAALAAFSWSLSFIVPFVIGDYSVFDFTLLEFILSGVLSAAFLCRHAKRVRLLRPRDWLSAYGLGLIGYLGYFLAVMGAARYAGPVIAPAFLGTVPLVLAVAGNMRRHTVSWRALALPLVLAAAGLSLVNGADMASSGSFEMQSSAWGIPLAVAAVTLWTLFGLMNESALTRRPTMHAGVWTALMMSGAGLAMLAFLPVGLMLGVFEIPRLGLAWANAGPLLTWAAALALFGNLGGALAWTFAAQRLPVALCAQLITLEPTSAAILGLIVHRRWPTIFETFGMVLLLVGVVIAIGVFSRTVVQDRPTAA